MSSNAFDAWAMVTVPALVTLRGKPAVASKLSPEPSTVAPGRITPDTDVPGFTKRGILSLFVVVVSQVTAEESKKVSAGVGGAIPSIPPKGRVLPGPLENRYFWKLDPPVIVTGGSPGIVGLLKVLVITHAACSERISSDYSYLARWVE
jgi:hypothetical protein